MKKGTCIIPLEEAREELAEIKSAASDWEIILGGNTTTDPLIIAGLKEFKFELKALQAQSAEYQGKFMFGGRNKYTHEVMSTV